VAGGLYDGPNRSTPEIGNRRADVAQSTSTGDHVENRTFDLQHMVSAETLHAAGEGLLVPGWHGPIPRLGSMPCLASSSPEAGERLAGEPVPLQNSPQVL
jgi:hypothetical protein